MHHIIKFQIYSRKLIFFKRFKNVIIWISNGKCITQKIEENLILAFKKYNLKLTFRKVNMNNVVEGIEFPDIFYVIDCNAKNRFFTKDFFKPTSKNTFF